MRVQDDKNFVQADRDLSQLNGVDWVAQRQDRLRGTYPHPLGRPLACQSVPIENFLVLVLSLSILSLSSLSMHGTELSWHSTLAGGFPHDGGQARESENGREQPRHERLLPPGLEKCHVPFSVSQHDWMTRLRCKTNDYDVCFVGM